MAPNAYVCNLPSSTRPSSFPVFATLRRPALHIASSTKGNNNDTASLQSKRRFFRGRTSLVFEPAVLSNEFPAEDLVHFIANTNTLSRYGVAPKISEAPVIPDNMRLIMSEDGSYSTLITVEQSLEEQDFFVYDPLKLESYFRNRPTEVAKRLMVISSGLGKFVSGIIWDRQTGNLEKNQRLRARQLREILTSIGPAFVKVGQALSTRPDLVPQEYLGELAEMQDKLPGFSDTVAYQLIERELGMPIPEAFQWLSPAPVAAASLGQVYKGKLWTGEDVAVKVQRPDVIEGIALDIYLVRNLASVAQSSIDFVKTDLVAIVDEFGSRIFQELNYELEGANAERFQDLYGMLPGVKVPRIYWERTSRRVLTMEWIEGVKLSNSDEIRGRGLSPIHFVDIGIECTLRQLFEHGFFHADPHPGNLLAMDDGNLAFLDFGMMSEAPQSARYALMAHVVHLVNRDFHAMAQDYYKLQFLAPDVDVSPIVPELAAFFESEVLQTNVSKLNFKTIVDGLGGVLYQFPFSVPPYYALILRSLTVLEGLAMYTDSDYKVIGKAYPYMARRLLTDDSPELRECLSDLLFKDGTFRWNRLENLIRESGKDQYTKSDNVSEQLIEYLLSETGRPLREKVAAELVRVLDFLMLDTLDDTIRMSPLPQPLALSIRTNLSFLGTASPDESKSTLLRPEDKELVQRIKNIITMVAGQGRAADLQEIVLKAINLLQRKSVQEMGQEVASGLMQRLVARTVRSLLR